MGNILALACSVALLGVAALAPVAATSTQAGTTVEVAIANYAFKAPAVTISKGTTVVWKNQDDDPHTITAVDQTFDSKGMGQGDTYSYRFTKAGKFEYYCKVHPFMKGVIIVKESQ